MEDLFDFIRFFLFIIGLTFSVAVFFGVVASVVNEYDCSVYTKNTGRKTTFEFGTCYVNLAGDRYIPQTELKYRAVTNEVE